MLHQRSYLLCFLLLLILLPFGVTRAEVVEGRPPEIKKSEWEAAEKGSPEAQYAVGNYMYFGHSENKDFPKNYLKAAEWWEKSAKQGHSRAMIRLGDLYRDGKGVKQDYAIAADWYRRAADKGYTDAQGSLGTLYVTGQGVKQDYREALFWLQLSTPNGAPPSIKSDIAKSESHLSKGEIEQVRVRVAEWRKRYKDEKASAASVYKVKRVFGKWYIQAPLALALAFMFLFICLTACSRPAERQIFWLESPISGLIGLAVGLVPYAFTGAIILISFKYSPLLFAIFIPFIFIIAGLTWLAIIGTLCGAVALVGIQLYQSKNSLNSQEGGQLYGPECNLALQLAVGATSGACVFFGMGIYLGFVK